MNDILTIGYQKDDTVFEFFFYTAWTNPVPEQC